MLVLSYLSLEKVEPEYLTSTVHTIGHSSKSGDVFLWLLGTARNEPVEDVRSSPSSRWAPPINKQNLNDTLKLPGIKYVPGGDTLGSQPSPDCHDPQSGKGKVYLHRLEEV